MINIEGVYIAITLILADCGLLLPLTWSSANALFKCTFKCVVIIKFFWACFGDYTGFRFLHLDSTILQTSSGWICKYCTVGIFFQQLKKTTCSLLNPYLSGLSFQNLSPPLFTCLSTSLYLFVFKTVEVKPTTAHVADTFLKMEEIITSIASFGNVWKSLSWYL